MNLKLSLHSLYTIVLLLALSPRAHSADWPQFAGPGMNATSPEKGLARQWPKEGPPTLWTVALGEGFASPAVMADDVYILDCEPGKRDILRCLSLKSGKEKWQFAYDAVGKYGYPGSRTVPALTSDSIFTLGTAGDLYRFDRQSHKAIWHRNILTEYVPQMPLYAIGRCPILYRDTVLVGMPAWRNGLAAFSQKDGSLLWQVPENPEKRDPEGSYVAPVPVQITGIMQVVTVASSMAISGKRERSPGKIISFSADTGKRLWSYNGFHCQLPIAHALPIGENRVFLTAAYEAESTLLEIRPLTTPNQNGEPFEAVVIFKTTDFGSQIHQPILYRDHLYMISNGNNRRDGMVCVDLKGNLRWQTTKSRHLPNYVPGLPYFERGNIMLADDLLFVMDGNLGSLYLIEPTPKGYRELSKAEKILESPRVWAPLVLSNGRLLIRDQKQMKCLDIREKSIGK